MNRGWNGDNKVRATNAGVSIVHYHMAIDFRLMKRQHFFKTIMLNMLGKFLGPQDKC